MSAAPSAQTAREPTKTGPKPNPSATRSELAAGATLQLNQRTGLYGELGRLWALGGDTRVKSGLQASVGVKVRW